VTSEEISTHFEVPIAVILLYPCFRLEQSHLVGGRSSSEAWIKNFSDKKTAQILAEKKTGFPNFANKTFVNWIFANGARGALAKVQWTLANWRKS
jgi:hypothetical protein